MPSDFNKQLVGFLRAKQNANAFQLVLEELARCLVSDRENFVEILNNSGVAASMEDSDVVLIEKFTQNVVVNQKLLLGAAMLINYRNKTTNFDGEDELSDAGVKNAYHVLKSNFLGSDEDYSNFIPALLGAGAKAVGGLVNKAKEKKEEANQVMMAKALEKRRRQAAEKAKKVAEAKKRKNTTIIVGASVITVALLAFIIYKKRRS